MLWPDPTQQDRLAEIRDNLHARIAEAEREGWLGEIEGLRVSLAGAEHKLAQIDQRPTGGQPTHLGMPTITMRAAGNTPNSLAACGRRVLGHDSTAGRGGNGAAAGSAAPPCLTSAVAASRRSSRAVTGHRRRAPRALPVGIPAPVRAPPAGWPGGFDRRGGQAGVGSRPPSAG